eukprot:tig00021179_g19302.t1
MAPARALAAALVFLCCSVAAAQTPTPAPASNSTAASNSTGPGANSTAPSPTPTPLPFCTDVGRVVVSPNNATINGRTRITLLFLGQQVGAAVQRIQFITPSRTQTIAFFFSRNPSNLTIETFDVGVYGHGYANMTLEMVDGTRVCVQREFRFNAPPEPVISLAPSAARGMAVTRVVRTRQVTITTREIGTYYEEYVAGAVSLPIKEEPDGTRPLFVSAADSYDPDGSFADLSFKWELEPGVGTAPLRLADTDRATCRLEPLPTAAWYWLKLTVADADRFVKVVRMNLTVSYNQVVSMRVRLSVLENATQAVNSINAPGPTREAFTAALARPFGLLPLQARRPAASPLLPPVPLRAPPAPPAQRRRRRRRRERHRRVVVGQRDEGGATATRRRLAQSVLAASFQAAPLFGGVAGEALQAQLNNATEGALAVSLAGLDMGLAIVPPSPRLPPAPPRAVVWDTQGSFIVDAGPSYDPDGYIARWAWSGYALDQSRTYRAPSSEYDLETIRRPLPYISDLSLYPLGNSSRVVIRDTTLYSTFFITVTITDNDGFVGSAEQTITVQRVNFPPYIAADPDPPCQNFPLLAPIVLRGGALDPNKDGSNLGVHPSLEWRLSGGSADAFRFESWSPGAAAAASASNVSSSARPPIAVTLPGGKAVPLPPQTPLLASRAPNESLEAARGTGGQRHVAVLEATRDGNYTVTLTATDWHGASVNVSRAVCVLPNWRRRVALMAADRLNVAVASALAVAVAATAIMWGLQALFPAYASVGWSPSYTLGILYHAQFLSLSGSMTHAPRDYKPITAALAWTNLQFSPPWGPTASEGGFPSLDERSGEGTFAGGLATARALARYSAANVFVGTFFYAVVVAAGVFFLHMSLALSVLMWRRNFRLLERVAFPGPELLAALALFTPLALSSANAARDTTAGSAAGPCAIAALVLLCAGALPGLWAAVHRVTSRYANFLWLEPPWGFDAWRRAAVAAGLMEPPDDIDEEIAVRGEEPVLPGDPRRGLAGPAAAIPREASPSPTLRHAGMPTLSPGKEPRRGRKKRRVLDRLLGRARRKAGRAGDLDDDLSPGQRAVKKYQRRAAREAAAWEEPDLAEAARRRRVPRRLVDRETGFLGFFRRWARRYSSFVFRARARLDPLLRRGEWVPAEGRAWSFAGAAPLVQDFVHGSLKPLWRSCRVSLPVPPAPYAACVAATRQALSCLCLGLLSERPTTQAALVLVLALLHLLWTLFANPLRFRPLALVHVVTLSCEVAICALVLQVGVDGPTGSAYGHMETAFAMNCLLALSLSLCLLTHFCALWAHASVLFATWYAGGEEAAGLPAAEARGAGPLMGVTRTGLPQPADLTPRTGVTVLTTAASVRTRETGATKGHRGARSLGQSLASAAGEPRRLAPLLGRPRRRRPQVGGRAAGPPAAAGAAGAAPPPGGRRVLGGAEWDHGAVVDLEPLPSARGPSFALAMSFGAPDLPNTPSPEPYPPPRPAF